MQPSLTDCARQSLDRAQAEARTLNQEFVGTEHLLLGILQTDGCAARQALDAAGIDAALVRSALLRLMQRGGANPPVITGKLPLSPRAQRALNEAIVMTRTLGQPRVSTRSLLAAIAGNDPAAPFATALREAGGDLQRLLATLSTEPHAAEQ